MQTFPQLYRFIGNQTRLSGLSAAKPISVPPGADGVLIQALLKDVHINFTDVPTTDDFMLRAGDPPVRIDIPGGTGFRVIEAAASAKVVYIFYSSKL